MQTFFFQHFSGQLLNSCHLIAKLSRFDVALRSSHRPVWTYLWLEFHLQNAVCGLRHGSYAFWRLPLHLPMPYISSLLETPFIVGPIPPQFEAIWCGPYFLRPILCSCCHHCSNEKNIDMHVMQKKHLAHLKKQPFRELSSSGLGSSEYFAEGCAEGSSIRTFTPHHRALHAPELLWHWPWALWPPTASCGRAVETCFRTAILVDIDVKEPL